MQSPDDDDNQHFHEVIKQIQVLASQITLEAMENYYYQLVTKLQTKLGMTTQKLSYYRQKLKQLVEQEEWVQKQRAHEELIDSLTNKLDKFSDKLDTRRAKKLEKLQHPGAKFNLPRKDHIEKTYNRTNKGKLPKKKREGEKQRKSSGSPAQVTPIHPPKHQNNPIPAWPHPLMMPSSNDTMGTEFFRRQQGRRDHQNNRGSTYLIHHPAKNYIGTKSPKGTCPLSKDGGPQITKS